MSGAQWALTIGLYLVGVIIVIWAFVKNAWFGLICLFLLIAASYALWTQSWLFGNSSVRDLMGKPARYGHAAAGNSPAAPAAAAPRSTTTTHASFEQVMQSVQPADPARRAAPQPAPTEEAPQMAIAKVYADSSAKLYYDKDCATHPENAILMSKSLAVSQHYRPAPCK